MSSSKRYYDRKDEILIGFGFFGTRRLKNQNEDLAIHLSAFLPPHCLGMVKE
jgi:hypothetical protein